VLGAATGDRQDAAGHTDADARCRCEDAKNL
jgi:hypothetical protein